MSILNLANDAATLEKLNMEIHEKYQQKDKALVVEDIDKKAFSEKQFLKDEVRSTLESRAEILKKADEIFKNEKEGSPFKREASSKYGSSSSSSSPYSYSSRSSSGYSYSSSKDNIEERVAKIMSKSQEIAEDMMDDPIFKKSQRKRRKKKKGFIDKFAPRYSTKRKILIVGGVILIEGMITALLYAQKYAKSEIFTNK